MVDWKPFNYLYMVIYLPQDEAEIKSILGPNWDPDQNRQNALAISQAAITANPNDAFAWFNLGSSLVYFERYNEAAQAFDKAFTIGSASTHDTLSILALLRVLQCRPH